MDKYTHAKKSTVFLALSAAFDCVSHAKIWHIVLDLGVDDAIVVFLRQIYSEAAGIVRLGKGGECSGPFKIKRGVRQGCVLAPFLFSLYTNQVGPFLVTKALDTPQLHQSSLCRRCGHFGTHC